MKIGFLDHWRSVDALLDHLAVSRAVLCGLSKGARVALMLAAHRPDRVAGVVAVNAWVHLTGADRAARCALYDLLLASGGRDAWATALLDLMGVAAIPAISRGFRRSLDRIDGARLRQRFYEMADYDQRGDLKNVASPVLVLRGARDAFVPEYCADDLCRLLPDARAVALPHCGHLRYLEDPEGFHTAIAPFLQSVMAAPRP